MSSIPEFLYEKARQAKTYHSTGVFDDCFIVKLMPNTKYRQTNVNGDVVFCVTTNIEENPVGAFPIQEGGRFALKFFQAHQNVWLPVCYETLLFDYNKAIIEKNEADGFKIDYSSNYNLFLFDLEAALIKRFGGSWKITYKSATKDGVMRINHDLNVDGKFVEGNSVWEMNGKIQEFLNLASEKLDRVKVSGLPKVYSDIKDGNMSLEQFVEKFFKGV